MYSIYIAIVIPPTDLYFGFFADCRPCDTKELIRSYCTSDFGKRDTEREREIFPTHHIEALDINNMVFVKHYVLERVHIQMLISITFTLMNDLDLIISQIVFTLTLFVYQV